MNNEFPKIIILSENSNPQDELGRTPLHDFAMGKGTDGFMTIEHANAAIDTINILVKMGGRFDIKDKDGNTPLDLALKHPIHESLKKEFIKLSLEQIPNLPQPAILDEAENKELLAHWKKFQKEDSAPLKTNSSAAFFQPATSSNSATYVEDSVQAKPRF